MKKLLIAVLFVSFVMGAILTYLYNKGLDKNLDINGVDLVVNMFDRGGWVYKKHPDEVVSKFYQLIAEEYNPDIVLDIGANYGFISLITAQYLPKTKFIVVEPNKNITPYLKRNIASHLINAEVYECVAGDERTTGEFHINPRSSQDSRVIGKKRWEAQPVGKVTIDYLLINDHDKTVFIKTDTQGYEEFVFCGGINFLQTNNKWIMRMEFCPALFKFHGTNTKAFLTFLINDFEVVDMGYIPYNTESISSLFDNKLTFADIDKFIEYVNKLKRNNDGYIDILIRPKQ